MFDSEWATRLHDAVADGCTADLGATTVDEVRRLLVGVQADLDRLQCVQARLVAEFEAREGHRVDGCPSMAAWLRRKLRLSGAETRQRRRAAGALVERPEVKAALDAGRIRPAHVDVFASGVKRLGATIMRFHQAILLPVAEACDPADLQTAVDRLRDTMDPDAADRDWVEAQEKYDFTLRRIGHGFDVSGYLDPESGAKLKQVLDSIAAPHGPEDERPVAQRRVEGLNALLTSVLDGGLPSDKGIRPHLAVTVGLDTLTKAVRGDRTTPSPPAFLAGYGPIGRDLLSRLACDAAVSVVLTETTDAAGRSPDRHVLDVGRIERLATAKQRLAVLIQQQFGCVTPGCNNTHLEIHHVFSWLDGGPTDMHNLAGVCASCHRLIHAGHLTCTRNYDGTLTFTNHNGTLIHDKRRPALWQFQRGLDPPDAA
jgi:Domain of unknown function (DUF222)/HNH endonuclease